MKLFNLELKKFIRQTISEAMIEMAKQPHEAEEQGLALSVIHKSNYTYLILFHPQGLYDLCYAVMNQPEDTRLDNKLIGLLRTHTNPVVGYIRMRKDADCGWIIMNSVADKGYGPMMYDIALSHAGKAGVLPDRNSVSASARNIWKHYITNRKQEIRVYPLASDDECAVYAHDPDGWFLDVRYVLRNPDLGKVRTLINKGDEAFEQAWNATKGTVKPEEVLRGLASHFFDARY